MQICYSLFYLNTNNSAALRTQRLRQGRVPVSLTILMNFL